MKQPYIRRINGFDYLYALFYAFLASIIPFILLWMNMVSWVQFGLVFLGVFLGYILGVHLKYKKLNQAS